MAFYGKLNNDNLPPQNFRQHDQRKKKMTEKIVGWHDTILLPFIAYTYHEISIHTFRKFFLYFQYFFKWKMRGKILNPVYLKIIIKKKTRFQEWVQLKYFVLMFMSVKTSNSCSTLKGLKEIWCWVIWLDFAKWVGL